MDLQSELSGETYRPGNYHYFRIHEPKERVVAAAPFRDRGGCIAALSTVPSQGLPDSPAHRRFCWWANNVMCGCGE
ncbi:MAG: hypothetical protein WCO86_04760 [Planctomycetota bacterium]